MFKILCLLFVIGCAVAEPPPSYLPPKLSLFARLDSQEGESDALTENSVVDQSYGPPSGSYGPPSNGYLPPTGNNKPPPVYGPPEEAEEPAKYSFEWEVKDAESGNEYGQKEERDGDNTVGSYNVLLPDGRKQIVDYTVDKDGYHPVIKYEEAKTNGGYRY